jgi:glucose-1-phosphate adenylyltransferase
MQTVSALKETLVMVLAGGQGERLYPLTKDRAKPAVPFGGTYRIIDFALSNCLNSGLRRLYVLTQYKSDSLSRHIRVGWSIFNAEIGEYIEIRPPQQRMNADWYLGTAHAIYQNIYTLEQERPRYVLILGGDHVYRMDYSQMLLAHINEGADATVACVEKPLGEAARQLGVVSVDAAMRVLDFEEKPDAPRPMPGSDGNCLCSMGIYVFNTETLVRRVIEDAKRHGSHDFGRDVIPAMIKRGERVFAFRFDGGYWRDIGTIDAYWDAHMDLIKPQPAFELSVGNWPIRGYAYRYAPVRITGGDGADRTDSDVRDSLLCQGCVVRGASVRDSVIGPGVRVEQGSRVEHSVILDRTSIGRNVVIRKAILDKDNAVPDGARMGLDPDWDRRHFTVSKGGVLVMAKSTPFPPFQPGAG